MDKPVQKLPAALDLRRAAPKPQARLRLPTLALVLAAMILLGGPAALAWGAL